MDNVVELKGLSKRYDTPAGPVQALDNMSLSATQGQIFGLLGPNGAGKTTAIEIAVGLRKADSGSVNILGHDPQNDAKWIRENVGVQPQEVTIFPYQKVGEILSFWSTLYEDPYKVEDVVAWLGLSDLVSRKVSKLSGGQHQRLNVGLALVGKPEMVFLDEPSTGLDVIAREKLWSVLRELSDQGMTIILSTHNLEEATALCDSVAVIDNGKAVAQGRPSELIDQHTEGPLVSAKVSNADAQSIVNELSDLGNVSVGDGTISIRTKQPDAVLTKFARLEGVTNISVKEPSLNDVFKNLVGREFEQSQAG